MNYINENKSELQQTYTKKKDVTSLNFKTEIDDDYDILVLSQLGDIIDNIIETLKRSDDVMNFFDLCVTDEPILELEYVKNAYNEMELTGNFIENYLNMIDEEFLSEIQSKIRNKILKKYPKRVRKTDVEDIEEVELEENDEESTQEEDTIENEEE
jgi:hypothetical protein